MTSKKRSASGIQITTIILIVIYGIWEKNVQQYLSTHPEDSTLNRIDLWFILPILALLIGISAWKFFKK